MASFQFSQALTANQLGFNPLTGWQYEFAPGPSYVRVLLNATGVSARATITTGSQTVQQRAPVGAGGTAGVMPNPLSNPVVEFAAMQGDRIIVTIDEVAGATPTVNGVVYIDPL